MTTSTRITHTALVALAGLALLCAAARPAPAHTAKAAIVGGAAVSQERFEREFSYEVALFRNDRPDSFLCGGSLVAPQWVLTAGHCRDRVLDNVSPRYAVLGRAKLDDENHGEVIRVAGAYQHPGWFYGLNNMRNDLMLLKLASPSLTGRPIALPPAGWVHPSSPAKATIAGWGLTSGGGTANATDLRTTELTIRSLTSCRDSWSRLQISSSMLCAGGPGESMRSICNGDSGGAITYQGMAIGIASFTTKQCRSNPFNVFTRVASFSNYVQNFIRRSLAPKEWIVMFPSRHGPRRIQKASLINPSAEPVTVKRLTIARGPFRVQSAAGCLGVLQPTQSCEVSLIAQRSRNRLTFGDLRVESDSLSSRVFHIRLYARG